MYKFRFLNQQPETNFHVIGICQKDGEPFVPLVYTHFVQQHDFKGKPGQTLLIQSPKETIVLLGMGECKTNLDFEKAGGFLTKTTDSFPSSTIAVTVYPIDKSISPEQMAYIASGAYLYAWRFDLYKTQKKDDLKDYEFVFVNDDPIETENFFNDLKSIDDGNITTRTVVNEPPNILYPESYANRIEEDFIEYGNIKVTVLDVEKMAGLGLNALLAVGQGSVHGSRLVVLEYYGDSSNTPPVAFVGKGVTFDTGGISIKPAANMDDMRYDMAGSGVVYGLFKSLSLRKAKLNAVGVLGLVENMPSGSAYRPADIIKSYSGQTIEVLNTDAEGRVVLADALWYAQVHFKPRIVIDLATLTGAIVVALGEEYAGLFSNDDELTQKLINAGKDVGELLWPMPMCDSYNKDIDSDFADVKNVGSGRGAGSSTAAHFLNRFIKEGTPWAHLDIAGVAWKKKDGVLTRKGATGFGVRLLNKFIDNYL